MSTPYNPKSTGKTVVTPGNTRQGNISGSNLSRQLPRQISTGSTRGTQTVGYGNTKIDGTNNSITIGDSILLDGNNNLIEVTGDDGSQVGMGAIPDSDTGEFGFSSTDSSNDLVMKIVNGTFYVYDITTNKNIIQIGKLPDGSFGMAVAATGFNVSDAISP